MDNQFGKVSKLSLTAARKDEKTILEDVSFTAPFKVMQPFYEKKGVMTVMALVASAGIMSGDRQEFTMHVKSGANMEFVSQAYEKIHKMPDGHAERSAVLTVDPHACLHYTPLPTIPYADSDYRSLLTVHLADETSRFLYSEVLSCGRVARDELFEYRRFQNQVRIFQGEQIVYYDNTRYEPDRTDLRGIGMYEGFTHLANLLICNEEKSDDWIRSVREEMDADERMEGGVTRTVQGHVCVRILGHSGQQLTDYLKHCIEK